MPSITKGEACYQAAQTNFKGTSAPHWQQVAEKFGLKYGAAIGLARKWALAHNERSTTGKVVWPLKAKRRNEKRYAAGRQLYDAMVADPTTPIKSLGGRIAERALYYFAHTEGPKPPNFVWPIPGRNKGIASGRARGLNIDRMELGEKMYNILMDAPSKPIRQVADDLGISRNKANNDLALFVKTKRANGGLLWPIPGRGNQTGAG